MKLTRTSRMRRRSLRIVGVVFALIFTLAAIATGYWVVMAEPLENDVRVEEDTELTYYLTVKYNGVDKYGVESTDTTTSDIESGTVEVTDRIPDGLDFVGFETTNTGIISAVERGDNTVSCPGRVIDDTNEASVEAGTWNAGHTEFTYHGLHYNANTRTVTFKAVNVQAGCDLTVGIVTKTPLLGNAERIDFYNTGRVSEGPQDKDSNTVHTWMGNETALVYNVTYSYTGNVPANAPALPNTQSYTQGATVGVAMEPSLDGYDFSGWTTSDASVSDGMFTMPSGSVNFVGIFTEKPAATTYTVTYQINGNAPAGYTAPRTKSYEAGETVNVDSTQQGDVIDDYVFSGWATNDATITDGSFAMPASDVVISGSFTRRTYTVTYAFEGDVLPPNASSLLPATANYPAGTTVTLAPNPSADGYRFTGWYGESSFTMPANNLTIYGEWATQAGVFSPAISISIPNQKDSYRINEIVEFDIVVTNTAEFPITNVNVVEQLDGAAFVAGTGYTISDNLLATIPTLAAGESITLKVQYTVTDDETREIINTVALAGATASAANYNIDTTQDYTASTNFNTLSWDDVPATGVLMNGIFPFVAMVFIGICYLGAYKMLRGSAKKTTRNASLMYRMRNLYIAPRLSRRIFAGVFVVVAVSSFAFFVIGRVFAVPTEPVSSIELTSQYASFASSEAGAWKVNKMAGWTGASTAKIVIDVESVMKLPNRDSDVLFVVDNGDSMTEDRLQAVKNALTNFADDFLNDENNALALVTFNHGYQIETDFTSNRNAFLAKISGISTSDNTQTNYYQGLNGAERLLRNYTRYDNRGVIVVFLTDGVPNEELLYQIAEYSLIKNEYPFVSINAIQYEMGNSIIDELTSISDSQFVATKRSIADVINGASVAAYAYDEFILTDYINNDYFTISSADSISVDKGAVSLEYDNSTPVITWDMSGELRSGSSARMEINVNLKSEYISEPGLYPTNKNTSVRSSLYGATSENVTTTSTPLLKTDFTVTYAANSPSDCIVSGIPSQETHYVYDIVAISNTIPTCSGYTFAGYEIVEDQVTRLNDDYFRMPEKNVTLGATWTKVDLDKRMDGTISTARVLYNEIAKKSLSQGSGGTYHLDDGLDFASAPLASNGQGVNTIASTVNDEYPIHYFRGAVTDNNVLFAGICWKAMRTTSTGGVKLVYNGEADSNNQCGDSRGNHQGFGEQWTAYLATDLYYGTDYTYDETTQTFTLSGSKTLARWSNATSDSLIGQYSCMSTDPNASCQWLMYVESKRDDTYAYVLSLDSTIPYNSIGITNFNGGAFSPAFVGYMYGDTNVAGAMTVNGTQDFVLSEAILKSTTLSTDFYYASGMTFGTDVTGKYSLTNPYQVGSESDYASLPGKYTFRASQSDYHNNVIYYITAVSGTTMYYLEMQDGETLTDVDASYMVGNNITDNGNGTYTLYNATAVKKSEWNLRYSGMQGKYTCGDGASTTCSSPQYIQEVLPYSYNYIPANVAITIAKSHDGLNLINTTTVKLYQLSQNPSNYSEYKYTCGDTSTTCTNDSFLLITDYTATNYSYFNYALFGSSVTWNGSSYTLNDTVGPENYSNQMGASTRHFVCPSFGQTTCSQVNYVFFYDSEANLAYYLTLTDGVETITQAFAKMNENRTESIIKKVIDIWYAHNLTGYADKIEDTPYCNDRSIGNIAGWDPSNPLVSYGSALRYGAFVRDYYSASPSLDCPNSNDAFSVDPANGNGDLTYPVGLISEDELTLAGHGVEGYSDDSYLYTSDSAWTMSPFDFSHWSVYGVANGFFWTTSSTGWHGITQPRSARPVISVIPGILILDGDGSASNPWVLE